MEVALLSEDYERYRKSSFNPSWPFLGEIATTRASYAGDFGISGLVYAFDYTLRFDAATRSLVPCIFEVQSLNESTVSFLRATDSHYSQSKSNNRIKQKFLQEIAVDKFTIKDHIFLNKAKQRVALAEGGCQDLQMPHIIIEAITDLAAIDFRYHQLIRQRNEQITKFLAENSGCDFVLKTSDAARGEGNVFITKEDLAKCKNPWQLVADKMGSLKQDAEFSLEVAVEPYKAMTGENVTFRAIMAIDDAGNFRGIKHWASLHDSFNSHQKNSRHYFLEGVKNPAKDDDFTTARGTQLEPSVEHHLGRAISAIKRTSEKEPRKAENARLLREQVTFTTPKTTYPTHLHEYMEALSDLFSERKIRCFGFCTPKIHKPLPLLEAEEKAKCLDLSGKDATNFVKANLVNLVRDSVKKGSKKLTELTNNEPVANLTF